MGIKSIIRKPVKAGCIIFYRIINFILPIDNKKLVFSSSVAKSYSGNPKAVYEELVRQGLDREYKCVWFYEKAPFDIPGNNLLVRYKSLKYLFHMATAKYWIFDARQPRFLRKSNKAVYIQTWHGTPLKKLALDMDSVYMAGEKDIDSYKEAFRKNAASWDYLISQNPFSTKTFRRAFDFKGEMLEFGYPRNDILFRLNNESSIKGIKESLGIPNDKRVILYAPTWRDDTAFGLGRYSFSSELDVSRMKEAFGSEYILIIKHHYLVEDNTDWSIYGGFVRVYGQSVDIASLYLVSDMLITDYSSVMFDYSLLKRPMYFFCYDIDRYKDILRGFYFDFEKDAPGAISKTTDELICDIKNNSFEEHKDEFKRFTDNYNPWDKGDAAQKVLSVLLKKEGMMDK